MTICRAFILASLTASSLGACSTPQPEVPPIPPVQVCDLEDLHWQLSETEEKAAFTAGAMQGSTQGRLEARNYAQNTLEVEHRPQINWSHYAAFASGFSVLLLVIPGALRRRSRRIPDAWGARLVFAIRHELGWLEKQLPNEPLLGRATRYLNALESKAAQNHTPLENLLSALERIHISSEAELATAPLAGERLEQALTSLQRLLPPEAA